MPPVSLATAPGFADPVHDAQRAFSALMWAMAEPGRVLPLAGGLSPPAPLAPELAAVALALLDYETPFWLDPPLAARPEVADFLRFHTGAPRAGEPAAARFAFCADGAGLPPFAAFAQGEPDDPDRSATLVVQVERFEAGPLALAGPGNAVPRGFGAVPLPHDFAARLAANAAGFPLGVDLILCAPGAVAAVPRTARPVALPGA
ncbi:phosphonate C-P lyase system protein PhnH [Xanthobacter sp. V4C-4]|uniref:phosphonate C-P lyase system protein PhnH n=1 Tax=Xanthobacter cornucopiae TaxID=3119924 RepID=UPI00372A57FB